MDSYGVNYRQPLLRLESINWRRRAPGPGLRATCLPAPRWPTLTSLRKPASRPAFLRIANIKRETRREAEAFFNWFSLLTEHHRLVLVGPSSSPNCLYLQSIEGKLHHKVESFFMCSRWSLIKEAWLLIHYPPAKSRHLCWLIAITQFFVTEVRVAAALALWQRSELFIPIVLRLCVSFNLIWLLRLICS